MSYISTESDPRITQSFKAGYHSEKLPDAKHQGHNLTQDALAIANHLTAEHNFAVEKDTVLNALVHGVEVTPFPEVENVLYGLAQRGDTMAIWTEGDTRQSHAQVPKVRSLGLEVALRNPDDPGNLVVYSSDNKSQTIPRIIDYSLKRRHNESLFIVDDRPANLAKARKKAAEHRVDPEIGTPDISYVWINRDNKPIPETLEPDVLVVSSLEEYERIIEERRSEGKTFTHILDLDDTLIDSKGTSSSREQALQRTVQEGTTYAPKLQPAMHALNGFHLIDTFRDGHFNKVHEDLREASHDFSGHQASIYFENGHIIKAYAREGHYPNTPEWTQLGGLRGAEQLIKTMTSYREQLAKAGFPVPDGARFYLGKDKDRFFVFEVAPVIGEYNLQDEIRSTDDPSMKQTIVDEILDASFPVLQDENLGADFKPANWVRDASGKIIHIDPLPVIMRDPQTKEVITEWPVIADPQIRDFLYDTHISPQAIGYRFYQELCQLDPGNRDLYKYAIDTKIQSWVASGQVTKDTADTITEAVTPPSSQVLEDILERKVHADEGFKVIDDYVQALSQPGKHPIYALREMSFAVTSHAIKNGISPSSLAQHALSIVEEKMGKEKCTAIEKSLHNLPEELSFLTVVRKLTHLAHEDAVAGPDEGVALDIIKNVTHQLI